MLGAFTWSRCLSVPSGQSMGRSGGPPGGSEQQTLGAYRQPGFRWGFFCPARPWPLCTPPSSDAVAAVGGPWHSIIKTSVSLMKSYPLLGRGETQVIMNQFSSGQPSAGASRGWSRITLRRGQALTPPSPAFGLAGAPPGKDAGPRADCPAGDPTQWPDLPEVSPELCPGGPGHV